MVGPNKPIDTNKFFVICSNVLGGCAGSTGPKELQNGSDVSYGGNFPSVTIKDMVKAQSLLIESLPNQYAGLHRKRGILDVEFCGRVVILR